MAGEGPRTIGVGAVALAVGLVLGGLPVRGQVRALRSTIETLEARPCGGSELGAQLARAFRERPWGPPDATPDRAGTPRARPAEEAPGDPIDPIDPIEVEQEGEPVDVEGQLDVAREALALRQRQAFAALEDQARPSQQQMATIEAAVATMNDELLILAHDFAETVRSGPPERRDAMVFAANTLDVLIEAEDALFEALTPGQREGLDPDALDPMAYVDPALIDVMSSVERSR